jgi:hypothetical protein
MAFWRRTNEVAVHVQLSQNGEKDDFVLLKCESLQLGDGPGSNEDVIDAGASG